MNIVVNGGEMIMTIASIVSVSRRLFNPKYKTWRKFAFPLWLYAIGISLAPIVNCLVALARDANLFS